MYADPYQLDNRAADPDYSSIVAELGDELDELIDCAGDSCRTAPTGDPHLHQRAASARTAAWSRRSPRASRRRRAMARSSASPSGPAKTAARRPTPRRLMRRAIPDAAIRAERAKGGDRARRGAVHRRTPAHASRQDPPVLIGKAVDRRGDCGRRGDRCARRRMRRRRRQAEPAGHARSGLRSRSPTSSSSTSTIRSSRRFAARSCRRRSRTSSTRAPTSRTSTTRRRCAVRLAPASSPASTATTTAFSSNKPGYGALDDNDNDLPVWLQRAGYKTAIVGKFLNGYEKAVDDKDDVAPGWDLWSVEIGNGRGYYDFKLAVNGKQRKERLQGRVPDRRAQRARRRGRPRPVAGDKPFFMWVTQSAPHVENINANSGGPCGGESVPPPRDLGRFAGRPASAACPACSRRTSPTSPRSSAASRRSARSKREVLRHRYECRIETLPAVDRGVGQIVDALREDGRARRHDPRLHLRQRHLPGPAPAPRRQGPRLRRGRAPAARRSRCRRSSPAASAPPATTDAMAANIDFAPTFLEWAGAETCPVAGDCRVMDGRSWLPLFDSRAGRVPPDRPAGHRARSEEGLGGARAAGSRARTRACATSATSSCATPRCPISRPAPASRPTCSELYDHQTDPFELDNLIADRPADTPARAAFRRRSPTSSRTAPGSRAATPSPPAATTAASQRLTSASSTLLGILDRERSCSHSWCGRSRSPTVQHRGDRARGRLADDPSTARASARSSSQARAQPPAEVDAPWSPRARERAPRRRWRRIAEHADAYRI